MSNSSRAASTKPTLHFPNSLMACAPPAERSSLNAVMPTVARTTLMKCAPISGLVATGPTAAPGTANTARPSPANPTGIMMTRVPGSPASHQSWSAPLAAHRVAAMSTVAAPETSRSSTFTSGHSSPSSPMPSGGER